MILTLIMSKFDWTYFDWLIFWSQFEMKIDKTGIATESRFSYPKDLVVLQERPFFECLSFNTKVHAFAEIFWRDDVM